MIQNNNTENSNKDSNKNANANSDKSRYRETSMEKQYYEHVCQTQLIPLMPVPWLLNPNDWLFSPLND